MDKRGIELSINTLVVLILGLFVLAGAILFIKAITEEASSIFPEVNAQTQRKIEGLLSNGLVAVPNNVRETGFGDDEVFAIGVRNKLQEQKRFKINFTDEGLILPDGTREQHNNIIPFYDQTATYTLEPNGILNYMPVKIHVPKGNKRGVYIFNVNVWVEDSGWQPYGIKQQLRITVR